MNVRTQENDTRYDITQEIVYYAKTEEESQHQYKESDV